MLNERNYRYLEKKYAFIGVNEKVIKWLSKLLIREIFSEPKSRDKITRFEKLYIVTYFLSDPCFHDQTVLIVNISNNIN